MRYFVTGEQQRKSLLNALVLMFLGYIALLWLSNALMYFHHMDLRPKSVIAYYLGSEEEFTQPKSYQGMLEVSHFHLFSMGILAVTLTHLMLMTNFSHRLKIWLSCLTYLSAIATKRAVGWCVLSIPSLLILRSLLFCCWKARCLRCSVLYLSRYCMPGGVLRNLTETAECIGTLRCKVKKQQSQLSDMPQL